MAARAFESGALTMKQDLSPSTQAILLLTAPLTLSPKQGKTEFLSLDEYNDLAQQLDTLKKEPADLLTMDLDVLLEACQTNSGCIFEQFLVGLMRPKHS